MKKQIIAFLLFPLMFTATGCEQKPDEKSKYVIDGRLVAPTISIDDNKVLSWEENKYANYYSIYVNDKFLAVSDIGLYQLEDRLNGTYNVQIRAHDKFYQYSDSDYSNKITYKIEKTELAPPNVTIDGDILKWPDVQGADSYKVYLDTVYQHTWKIKKDNGINTCKMSFSSSGKFKIDVTAYSSNTNYEREKTKTISEYKISLDKIWYPKTMLDDWQSFGDVQSKNNLIVINEGKSQISSGITNNTLIDDNHDHLYVTHKKGETVTSSSFAIKVNNTLVNPLSDAEKDPSIADNTFVYDLSRYSGLAASIKLELLENITLNLEGVRLFTDDNTSHLKKWDIAAIPNDWVCVGTTEKHGEGYCLHYVEGVKPSFTTDVIIEDETTMSFLIRKFERMGEEQDKDPIVYVYVNGTVIRPIDSSVDYATCNSDAYEEYKYDLSSYSGQRVTIKIESIIGEHCAFGYIQLDK